MQTIKHGELLKFLHNHLEVSSDSLDVALKQWKQDPGPLPMVLWQYGLVSLDQLDQIYDWMDSEI